MFYHQQTNSYINENTPFVINGVQYPSNWLNLSSAQEKEALGLREVIASRNREDARYFDVQEQLNGAVLEVTNTPKPAEVIAAQERSLVGAVIASLEERSGLTRLVREAVINLTETQSTPEQLAQNVGYTKLKDIDLQIRDLRTTIAQQGQP